MLRLRVWDVGRERENLCIDLELSLMFTKIFELACQNLFRGGKGSVQDTTGDLILLWQMNDDRPNRRDFINQNFFVSLKKLRRCDLKEDMPRRWVANWLNPQRFKITGRKSIIH